MPHCYGYRRVSGKRQARKGLSLPDQHDRIVKYAGERSLPAVEMFTDPAVTSKVPFPDRPAGGELLRRIRKGDHLVVTKLDRGWRNLLDFLHCFDNFNRQGIALHIIDFGGNTVDPTTPTGRAIIQILAVVAQLEREMIGERVADAHAYLREQGLYLNQNVPRGFTAVKNPKGRGYFAVPDPGTRQLMDQIIHWRDELQMTWDAIRQHLMAHKVTFPNANYRYWSPDNVYRLYQSGKALRETEKTEKTVDVTHPGE